jgi:hypothetical protein
MKNHSSGVIINKESVIAFMSRFLAIKFIINSGFASNLRRLPFEGLLADRKANLREDCELLRDVVIECLVERGRNWRSNSNSGEISIRAYARTRFQAHFGGFGTLPKLHSLPF